jgi:hypothetical protein
MSAGDYYPQMTDSGYNPLLPIGTSIPWQPPRGWETGDAPSPWQPWPPVPQVYPEPPSKRIPDPYPIITTTDTRSLWLGQNADRIAALEAEVKRLGRECKRLRRKLAQWR